MKKWKITIHVATTDTITRENVWDTGYKVVPAIEVALANGKAAHVDEVEVERE